MHYKRLLSLLILFTICYSTPLFAQFSIHGKILNEQGKPFDMVNISLLSLPDSILYMQTSTNESGQYDFRGNTHGNYALRISAIGYETQWSKSYAIASGDHITATPIILKPIAIAIQEVRMYGKPALD